MLQAIEDFLCLSQVLSGPFQYLVEAFKVLLNFFRLKHELLFFPFVRFKNQHCRVVLVGVISLLRA
jgi:hypothetical protein